MADQQQKLCKNCHRYTLHARASFNIGIGLLLTLLTAGGFLLLWIPLAIIDSTKPYRCQVCGQV